MLPLRSRRSNTLPISNCGKRASVAPRAIFSRSRKTARVRFESREFMGRAEERGLAVRGVDIVSFGWRRPFSVPHEKQTRAKAMGFQRSDGELPRPAWSFTGLQTAAAAVVLRTVTP